MSSDTADLTDTASSADAGAFSGDIEIVIEADASGLTIHDVCAGTVSFELDDRTVSGTLSCSFSGTVSDVIGKEPFTGTIDGTADETGAVTGPFWMNLKTDSGDFGVLDTQWSGTLAQDRLDGTLGDDMEIAFGSLQVPVIYSGTFSATRN